MGKKQAERQRCWHKLKRIVVLIGFLAALVTIIPVGPKVIEVIKRILCSPPLPPGLVIFGANEWHEQVISGKKEIVCKPQTELNVNLRKVGIGMEDAIVERHLA